MANQPVYLARFQEENHLAATTDGSFIEEIANSPRPINRIIGATDDELRSLYFTDNAIEEVRGLFRSINDLSSVIRYRDTQIEELEETIKENNEKIEELNERIEELNERIEESENKNINLNINLEVQSNEISVLKEEIDKLKKENGELMDQLIEKEESV